jgi:hypothetical protein
MHRVRGLDLPHQWGVLKNPFVQLDVKLVEAGYLGPSLLVDVIRVATFVDIPRKSIATTVRPSTVS